MQFDLIQYQDDLALQMLSMPSFQRYFAGDAYANAGYSQSGRRRTKRAAIKVLTDLGYPDRQARIIVQDAQDYAGLLYNAHGQYD